jgi:hypothetical protein
VGKRQQILVNEKVCGADESSGRLATAALKFGDDE